MPALDWRDAPRQVQNSMSLVTRPVPSACPLPRQSLTRAQGVLLVLGQQDVSWNNMKKFLGVKAVKDEASA
jgi:hypothetical protein